MLQVDHINKTIQGRIILEDISFDLAQGNLIISGPSGCGKSTLAHIIAGLDKQYTGSLRLDGRLMHDYKTKQWMRDIQYVPQYLRKSMYPHPPVEGVSPEPLKRFGIPKTLHASRVDNVLSQCQLSSQLLQQRVSTLSGGQFQRVWIAKALIIQPKLLILDEATTNLDVVNEDLILQMLQSLTDIQLLIISHDPYVIQQFEAQHLSLT